MATLILPKTLPPYVFHISIQFPRLNIPSLSHLNPRATRAMSSGSTQRIFQLKLDPLTGNSEWVVVEENDDFSEGFGTSKPNLATTSYLDMLNDSWRNRAYREAIDKTITKPCHVLDIGAGTGLLSMMAARAMDQSVPGPSKGIVTACESFLPMVKLMRKMLRLNGMERKINIINKRSDEVKVGVDINSRADVLVSEILDSELLGEGLIPTLQNAHDMLLAEHPLTVPYKATTYGQLVESNFLWKLHDLHGNEIYTSDGIQLVPNGLDTTLRVKPQQYPMQCSSLLGEIELLSEPFKIFEFDFWKRPDSHGKVEIPIKAAKDGRVNSVVSWWVLQLDSEGTIFYSTAPKWIKDFQGAGNWCDHWKQCVWFVPGKGISVSQDQEVHLHALHSDISISYNLRTQTSESRPSNFQDDQLMLSPERIAIYGDKEWRHSIVSALRKALDARDSSLCVVADDSVFLAAAIAHLSKSSHVITLFPGLRAKGSHYLQAIAEANHFPVDRIEVIGHSVDCLLKHTLHQRKVDLLIGEPFYYGNDNQLPWQNLRFWKERTVLREILSEDAKIMPCKGILKACAMFLPDLWRSRCSLGKIEGFDHLAANVALGACGNLPPSKDGPFLPFFIWQCGEVKELSERFTVMEFDILKPMTSCSGKVKVEFTAPGICHGFVLWIDWVMDEDHSIIVPTGPDQRCWKQGLKLVSEPFTVQTQGGRDEGGPTSAELEVVFDSSNGDLLIKHEFV